MEWHFLSFIDRWWSVPGTGTHDIINIFGKWLNARRTLSWYLPTMEKRFRFLWYELLACSATWEERLNNYSIEKKKNQTFEEIACLENKSYALITFMEWLYCHFCKRIFLTNIKTHLNFYLLSGIAYSVEATVNATLYLDIYILT